MSDDPTPAEVLDELDRHDELVLALVERDLDGLPAAVRRRIDGALGEGDPAPVEPPAVDR